MSKNNLFNLEELIDQETIKEEVARILSLDNDIIIFDSFISNKCNLKCKHCYFGETQPIEEELTLDKWICLINEAINNNIKHFHFSGKEPLMDGRIFTILDLLNMNKSKYKLFYGLITNGISVDCSMYNNILSSGIDYMEISIDGNEHYHELIRGTGTFGLLIKTIKDLKEKEKINISTTISEINKNDLFILLDIVTQCGITKFFISPLQSIGNARTSNLQVISPEEYIKIIELAIDKMAVFSEPKISIRFNLPIEYTHYIVNNRTFIFDKLTAYIENEEAIVWNINGHLVELSPQFFQIPYLNRIIVTTDGFVLPSAHNIHDITYNEKSMCNVRRCSFNELLNKRNIFIKNYFTNTKFKDYETVKI